MRESRRRKDLRMITTVMLDLDGTLLPFEQEDFVKLYFKGLCEAAAPLGYEPETLVKDVWSATGAMVRNDGSRTNHDAFWETFRSSNFEKPDIEPLCNAFYVHEFDAVKSCLRYKISRRSLIEQLRKAGLDTILATNPVFPLCAVKTRLAWVGLSEEDFSYITTYENSCFSKPNPKYFEEILEKCGKTAAECVMIGNSFPEDIVPTKTLGIKSYLIPEFLENPNNEDTSGFKAFTLDGACEDILSQI